MTDCHLADIVTKQTMAPLFDRQHGIALDTCSSSHPPTWRRFQADWAWPGGTRSETSDKKGIN